MRGSVNWEATPFLFGLALGLMPSWTRGLGKGFINTFAYVYDLTEVNGLMPRDDPGINPSIRAPVLEGLHRAGS